MTTRPLSRVPLVLVLALAGPAGAWGDRGHLLVNETAASGLPASAPELLRRSRARLTWLGPEPDRWRVRELEALDRGLAPDHFVDLELARGVDPAAPPPTRHEYARVLLQNGQQPDNVGFAPYRIVELCQQLEASVVTLELIDPRHPDATERRAQAEADIIYVAGILGHFVGDLGNPHHTTINYNGWTGDNPEGFATDKGTHSRFESEFVNRVGDHLACRAAEAAHDDLDYARAAWDLVRESNGLVPDLYRMDKAGAFAEGNEESEAGRAGKAFVEARISRSATLLRDLWLTAFARGHRRAAIELVRVEVDRALEARGIDLYVTIDARRQITLRGRCRSPEEAAAAVDAATATPGVTRVIPRIAVLY